MNFKVGDRIRGQYGDTIYVGTIVEIGETLVQVDRDGGSGRWSCLVRGNGKVAGAYLMDDGTHNLELLTKRKTIMQKLTPMLRRALSKELQTLYKADYIDGDLELTKEGRNAMWAILLETNKEEVVKLAQEKLDEEKRER